MHYIIGAQFSVPLHNSVKPHGGVTKLSSPDQQPVKEFKTFKPNTTYTLHNIQMVKEEVEYTFNGSAGDTVKLKFDSTTAGDEFIAKVKREVLPDYSKFYQNRND